MSRDGTRVSSPAHRATIAVHAIRRDHEPRANHVLAPRASHRYEPPVAVAAQRRRLGANQDLGARAARPPSASAGSKRVRSST